MIVSPSFFRLVAVFMIAATPAFAAESGDAAGAAPLSNDTVYMAFHQKPGIDRVVQTLIAKSVSDPRISDIFKNQDLTHLRLMLADQFCYLMDGPCQYTGKDMKAAHKDMGLQMSDFNALVEDLQYAMDKEGVPFRAQNKLLAKLAPMERVVVVR